MNTVPYLWTHPVGCRRRGKLEFSPQLGADILRHVLDVLLTGFLGQTGLFQLVGTFVIQDKLINFKYAGFEESLSYAVKRLLFCNLKRDLA